MKRIGFIFLLTACLFACGGEKPSGAGGAGGDGGGGAGGAGGCEGESNEELCNEAGAICGELLIEDRCDALRMVSCGTCEEGKTCRSSMCIDDRPAETLPCLLVPEGGECADFRSVHRCEEVDGAQARVVETCGAGEICVSDDEGAGCRPVPEQCQGSISFCTGEGSLMRCSEAGVLEAIACESGCSLHPEGAFCRVPTAGTSLHEGKVFYEHRSPDPTFSRWEEPALRPAADLAVGSFSDGILLDAAVVREDGTFEVLVRDDPGEADHLVFSAYFSLMGGESTSVQVFNPDLPSGMQRTGDMGKDPTLWAWTISDPRTKEVVIREKDGSGAIQVFENMVLSVRKNAVFLGLTAPQYSGWWAPGVDWDCGACFTDHTGYGQIFVSGGSYLFNRSDSVLLHESGHNAFHVMGPELYEAGQHCIGVPAPPGQALSEGHASWYSADLRRSGIQFADYGGTFFFWDIDTLRPEVPGVSLFAPPSASGGLSQHMNESWVSVVLWRLAKEFGSGAPIHESLMAKEMRVPFASKYTGKLWWHVDDRCRPVNPMDSREPTPILSDLLDGLVCGGFPSSLVDDAVRPYPYDASEPSCK